MQRNVCNFGENVLCGGALSEIFANTKENKPSAFGSLILALIALALFAGCSVYLLDGSAASGGSYTASQLARSYTGSSTLNAKLLDIMHNCTDPAWEEWLEAAYPGIIGSDGFKTTAVTSTALTLSAGGSFSMTVNYTSSLYPDGGSLEISGTWNVSGSTVTFNYSTSNVEDWDTAPPTMASTIETLVNGAELWTDGSNLYGRFGYGNYWTDSNDTLFTR